MFLKEALPDSTVTQTDHLAGQVRKYHQKKMNLFAALVWTTWSGVQVYLICPDYKLLDYPFKKFSSNKALSVGCPIPL